MATNGGTARDPAARRRRIAERGAERLALITGRIQSLSPSPSPSPSTPVSEPQPSSTPPCPTSVSPNSDQVPIADEDNEPLLNTETGGVDLVSDVQTVIEDSETITRTSEQTFSKFETTHSISDTLTEQNPLISTSNRSKKPESQTRHHTTFSPKQLRPAITASENIRTICSIIIALLVTLANAGFPLLGSDTIKKIILYRPLLLLLVTNITIVAAHFLLRKVKHGSTGDAGFANPIGTALEWGLLMKTGSSALFMDCSVYSVVVICGLGLLQLFRL